MSDVKVHKQKNIFQKGAIAPSFIAESIQKHSTRTDIGAHEIFLGQVRADLTQDNKVIAIEYTAYHEMALEQMHIIREEAFANWPITCMHVHHCLGEVKAGEICFFVFASSAHRQPAREAVAWIVDQIKEKLPIFGKEIFSDGEHQWKSNT